MYLVIERFFVTGYIRMLGGLGENNEHLWKSLKFLMIKLLSIAICVHLIFFLL